MAFSQFFLRLALAVSVTLAVTQVEDPLTITCQNIRHDSTFEFDALEKRNSNEISLENCKIDTPSNYSSENKLRCSSCSVLGIGGGLRKGKIVSETVRLNLMKLHERTKRQGNIQPRAHFEYPGSELTRESCFDEPSLILRCVSIIIAIKHSVMSQYKSLW